MGNDQPRYLALLIHGYGEHLGRYQYVARTLQAQGARVFGPDHLGHGLSQGERVLIEDYDAVVDDVQRVVSHFRQQYPALPLVVIGHSMGGMIATRYVQRYGEEVRAGAVRPAAWRQNGDLRSGRTADDPRRAAGYRYLARDPAVGAAYQEDPLVWHGPFKRPTLRAMQRISPPSTPGRASARCPRCGSTATTIGWC